MEETLVSRYFRENSAAWTESGYIGGPYTFPTGNKRTYKTVKILDQLLPNRTAEIVDLGCGAGQLCLQLATLGYTVTGVDESQAMLCQALNALASMPEGVRQRVRFLHRNLLDNKLTSMSFDAATALGVIGYLSDDHLLFEVAARLLRPGGVFILSCRNRLFNMVSISDYTVKETEHGGAKDLMAEIRGLYQEIPEQDAVNFVNLLGAICNSFSAEESRRLPNGTHLNSPEFTTSIEPRQHTPKHVLETAENHGFTLESFYGVHPHLLMAGLNRSFPPYLFNLLSGALEVLDHLPASLIWSSVFIGAFRRAT